GQATTVISTLSLHDALPICTSARSSTVVVLSQPTANARTEVRAIASGMRVFMTFIAGTPVGRVQCWDRRCSRAVTEPAQGAGRLPGLSCQSRYIHVFICG